MDEINALQSASDGLDSTMLCLCLACRAPEKATLSTQCRPQVSFFGGRGGGTFRRLERGPEAERVNGNEKRQNKMRMGGPRNAHSRLGK